jgi:hypothetical protein
MKIVLLVFLFISTTFGAGVTSHRFMSKKSLDYMRDAEVRDMLRRNFGTFLGATMLPDMGYLLGYIGKSNWWGEETHWPPFLNWLWTYNNNKCKSKGWPPKGSSDCEQLWTIYFGVLSHSIGDIQWHGGYIFRFGVMESGAAVKSSQFNAAHTIADNMGDLPAVHLYGERSLGGSMNYDLVANMLNEFARFRNKPGVSKNDLILSHNLQEAWYAGIKLGWPAYYYFKLKYKWGHDNYYGTLGGIDNTARRIAELTDMISWENKRLGLSKITNLSNGGNWPFDWFRITRADGSQTVEKSYHVPNYQLDPRGTYNCRWGLYLVGVRLFTYGDVSRCPYKATGDYQKAQCEHFKYWPTSCKIY